MYVDGLQIVQRTKATALWRVCAFPPARRLAAGSIDELHWPALIAVSIKHSAILGPPLLRASQKCGCNLTLRAKGALISEPRFSTPCEMRFFPCEKGKTAFFKENPSTKAVFPFSRGKNRISQGVENRGSLISVPLALRVIGGPKNSLGGRFRYFLFFLSSGEGKGESEAPGRGRGRFFIENPRRVGERPRGGAGRVSAGNWGGWLNIFFRGRNSHQVAQILKIPAA